MQCSMFVENLVVMAFVSLAAVNTVYAEECVIGAPLTIPCSYDAAITHIETYWRHKTTPTSTAVAIMVKSGTGVAAPLVTPFETRISEIANTPGNCGMQLSSTLASDTGIFVIDVTLIGSTLSPETSFTSISDPTDIETYLESKMEVKIDGELLTENSINKAAFSFEVSISAACMPTSTYTIQQDSTTIKMCTSDLVCKVDISSNSAIKVLVKISNIENDIDISPDGGFIIKGTSPPGSVSPPQEVVPPPEVDEKCPLIPCIIPIVVVIIVILLIILITLLVVFRKKIQDKSKEDNTRVVMYPNSRGYYSSQGNVIVATDVIIPATSTPDPSMFYNNRVQYGM